MKKLPAWTHRFVMPFILTLLMTACVSLIATIRVAGFGGVAEHWLDSWLWSWVIAYPVILVIFPIVRWMVSRVVEEPH